MKRIALFSSLVLFSSLIARAQDVTTSVDTASVAAAAKVFPAVVDRANRAREIDASRRIKPYAIELAYNKTTCIIFKSPIRSVDIGSRDIIGDKAAEVENVLRIKASVIGFNETNFSVMTADGKFYSFLATYNEYPTVVSYDLSDGNINQYQNVVQVDGGEVVFADVQTTQEEVVSNCISVSSRKKNLSGVGTSEYKMDARIPNIYVKDNLMYLKIRVENQSNINYDMDYIRFFITDEKVAKQTSRQELEILPLYIYNEPLRQVKGNEFVEKVFVFQKFTIPNDKTVRTVIGEKNGGRTLNFKLKNKDIMQAGSI